MTEVERKRNKITITCKTSQEAQTMEKGICRVMKLTKKPKILERMGKKLEKRIK